MVDQLIRTIVEHPKRKLLVIILTLITGVVFGLPSVEEYSAAQARMASAREKLTEASGSAANLPQVQASLELKKNELAALERKTINDKEIEKFRDSLQRLIRETGCEMREVSVDELPQKRSWMSKDSPLRNGPVADPGTETPFVLAQWNARMRIEGTMGSIYKFLASLHEMDRFIQTREVNLQRAEGQDNRTQLRMDITLYDLTRKKAE